MRESRFEIEIKPAIKSAEELRSIVKKLYGGSVTYSVEPRDGGRRATLIAQGDEKALVNFGKALNGRAFGKKLKLITPSSATPAAPTPPSPFTPTGPAVGSAAHPHDGLLATAANRPNMTNGQNQSRPPFHFVPKSSALDILDTSVDHDRIDLEERYTGTLCCTLTALTPMLAANDQYDFQLATNELKRAMRTAIRGEPHAEKKILVPLTLEGANPGIPGPVVIGGTAIEGMLRNALAAMLASPMERVQERNFSYRPNVKLDPARDDLLQTRAGVVKRRSGNATVEVAPTNGLVGVIYVRGDAVSPLFDAWGVSESNYRATVRSFQQPDSHRSFPEDAASLFRTALTVKNVRIDERRARGQVVSRKLVRQRGDVCHLNDVYLLPYRSGLDGRGIFNSAFHDDDNRRGYSWVLVALANGPSIPISAAVVQDWERTLRDLRDDQHGHLLRHPDIGHRKTDAEKAIDRILAEGLRPGDVVFFEQEKAAPGRVVTLGHHFRYRWRYRDTIHGTKMRDDASDFTLPESANLRLRSILCPPPLEREVDAHGKPKQLSAARLLFGYVGTRDGAYHDDEPTTFDIGAKGSDYSMRAGRIACNHAIEQGAERPTTDRFLNAAPHHLVYLKPLGSPKPSAVEHYLTQDRRDSRPDKGLLCTFGDTDTDASAGTLNGRKFYLHQPGAGPATFELRPATEDDRTLLQSQQTSVGRFVSLVGTHFRFALRFVELRDWELGALLVVLDPTRSAIERLSQVWGSKGSDLAIWLKNHSSPADAPFLAHKLGHGRPLGLGSVRIDIDCMRRLRLDESSLIAEDNLDEKARTGLVDAFANRVAGLLNANLTHWVKQVFIPWLEIHRYVGRSGLSYPVDPATREIFTYHSLLRAEHAGGRKRQAAPRPHRGLADVSQL